MKTSGQTKFKVNGCTLGIIVRERGTNDDHCEIVIGTTKGDHSGELDSRDKIILSSYWLAELSLLLGVTKQYLETICEKEPRGYGYKFKEIKQDTKGESNEQ